MSASCLSMRVCYCVCVCVCVRWKPAATPTAADVSSAQWPVNDTLEPRAVHTTQAETLDLRFRTIIFRRYTHTLAHMHAYVYRSGGKHRLSPEPGRECGAALADIAPGREFPVPAPSAAPCPRRRMHRPIPERRSIYSM